MTANPFHVGDRVRARHIDPDPGHHRVRGRRVDSNDIGHHLVKKGKATIVWAERDAVRVRFDEDGLDYHPKIHWTRLVFLDAVEWLGELA